MFSYIFESVLAGHLESRNEPARDTLVACKVFTRENISYLSKIELPHYSVDFYPNMYIYCDIQGNNRSADNTEDKSEFYIKCKVKCQNESNVSRRRKRSVVESNLKNKNYDYMTFKCVD